MYTPLDVLSIETWALIAASLVLIRLYIHKRWQALKNLNIPHDPPSIMGCGNLGELMKNFDMFFNGDFGKIKRHGRIYGEYSFLNPAITVADPDILRHIFIKEFSLFSDRQKAFRKLNGKEMYGAVLNASGDEWKRIRSTLTPGFSTYKLKEMIGIIDGCVDQTIDNLKLAAIDNNGRFSAKETFSKLSMDVICSTVFSANVHSQVAGKTPKVVEMAHKAFNNDIQKNPLFFLLLIFPWFEHVLAFIGYTFFPRDTLNYFKALTDKLIKREESTRSDIMQTMLKTKITEAQTKAGLSKGLTQNEIVGNSIIFILAGYETTANSLLFLAYNLATHKEAQDKLREEIEQAVEKHGKLSYDCVMGIKYLDMCMNESLRLYTPVGRNQRVCDEDVTINGLFIPKNMVINIPVYALAHDEEYWEKPFEFNPERMSDMDAVDPMTFTPFGAGPRNCIAMRFAQLELKITMCKLLMEFDLDVCDDTPPPPLEMSFKGSMVSKKKFDLKIMSRKNKNQ